MKKIILISAAIVAISGSSANASSYSGTCTKAAKSTWMTEAAVQAKVTTNGFKVAKIKTTRSGNCYEVYVTDKAGKQLELFLDPTSAKIVHTQ